MITRFFMLMLLLTFSFSPSKAELLSSAKVDFSHTHSIDWDATEQNVYVFIHSDEKPLKAGESKTILIEQVMRPHWHTYWINPGDSGEPLRANWTLPEGFEISPILWPTPQKLPFPPLVNYGYENHAVLITTITAPSHYDGSPLSIPVRFDVLVCKDICIPESTEITLKINAPNPSVTAFNFDTLLEEARSLIPVPQAPHQWNSKWEVGETEMVLHVETNLDPAVLKSRKTEFFPFEYGLISNSALPEVSTEGKTIILKQAKGDFAFDKIKNTGGILVLEDPKTGIRTGYELMPQSPEKIASPLSSFDANASATDIKDITIGGALLFAVLGGLILNLMPCVFPVLSMKVLSLSQISEKSALSAKQHGLAYTAGIILSFLFIASLLIVLKSGGSGIGWGFHLQNPIVILLLAYLFFMIGLNLSGFFEIGNRLMNIGSNTSQVGLRGSFMTGVLATVVATPCTAPFMAAALGYALVQPAYVALLIFAALGLGLALPYLMISFFPALQKAMPRPGAWMITFKEFLAFPMFATVIWLLWVLSQQIGSNGFFIPLMGILGLSLAVWFLNQSSHTDKVKKSILLSIGMITLLGSALSTIIAVQSIEMAKERPMPAFGQTFSEDSLEKALEGNDPVFVEMTAAWCVTCKVNNFTSIDIQQTRDILKKLNISYFIGDWTNYDPTITSYLNKYGRNGVPLYIFYGGRDNNSKLRPDPVILPQILTPSLVAETFNR